MKRIIAFLFIGMTLIGLKEIKVDKFDFLNNFDSMIVICENKIDGIDNFVQNGNQYYYTFNANQKNILNEIEYEGVVFKFKNDFNLENFKNYVDFISQSNKELQGYEIYYGYYSGYNDFRFIDGKKINFQLAYHDSTWILGFPLIMTGF